MLGQQVRPLLERRRPRSQVDRLTSARLVVGAIEVLQEHPPRHAVDDKVVNRDRDVLFGQIDLGQRGFRAHRAVHQASVLEPDPQRVVVLQQRVHSLTGRVRVHCVQSNADRLVESLRLCCLGV